MCGTSETDPRRHGLEDRENELLRAHEAAWLGDVPKTISGWKFERGFVAEFLGPTGAFATLEAADLFARHPATRLRLSQPAANQPGPAAKVAFDIGAEPGRGVGTGVGKGA